MMDWRGIIILPFFMLTAVLPIIITIWFLLKIQSMDTTLKEISLKLDRMNKKTE